MAVPEWLNASGIERLARVDRQVGGTPPWPLAIGTVRTVWGEGTPAQAWTNPAAAHEYALFVSVVGGDLDLPDASTFLRWRSSCAPMGALLAEAEVKKTRKR